MIETAFDNKSKESFRGKQTVTVHTITDIAINDGKVSMLDQAK